MATAQELLVVIDASTERLRRELNRADAQVAQSTRKIERELGGIDAAFTRLNKTAAAAGAAMSLVFAAMGAASGIGAIVRINDAYTRMASRLRLVTDSSAELAQIQNKLFALAQQTRSEYEGVVDLYVNLAANTKELGLSQGELIDIVRVSNQAIQISGASAEEASAGVRQLIQGLASGELRGEELRSVMEQTRRLARAIADGLHVSIGGLRDMAEAGELTTARVIQALMSQRAVIEREFGGIERTVSQAMVQLQNSVNKAVAGADMSALVEALDELRAVVSDPDVQRGIASLATLAVNFVADMAKALALLGNAIADIGKVDELLGAVFERLAEQSGPAVFSRLVERLQHRLGDFAAGELGLRKPGAASPSASKIPTIKIRGGRTIEPLPERFFDAFTRVTPDDLIASREREIARLDELRFKQFGKGAAPGMGMEIALPEVSASAEALEAQLKEVNTQALKLDEVGGQLRFTFSSAFEEAIVQGNSLRGVVQGLAQDLQRILLRALVTKPLGNALSSIVTGGLAAAFGDGAGASKSAGLTAQTGSFSSALGASIPTRAGGGPVMAGQPYLVGEQGRELFVPSVPGRILPHGVTNNLGGTTVHQTVNVTLAGGTADEIARLRQEIQVASAHAARAGAEGGRALVISDLHRGGPTARALGR
ncbi:MAG: tape measure protein [Nitrococcus sp.]|nr:tape measure protein [Nitrococcus sp.]